MDGGPRMAFNGVWPTYLVRRQLPGAAEHTPGLVEYIDAQEARETDFTARYNEQRFFSADHAAVRWLKAQVDDTVGAFIRHSGVQRPVTWFLFGWYNINRLGDHHAPHTHPRSYLSGTFYVQVPPPPANLDDPRAQPACISFYDPRTGANMVSAGTEYDARPAHVVRPSPGTLLLWPSPVQHYVHPNLSGERRISISFNVILDPASYWPADLRGA